MRNTFLAAALVAVTLTGFATPGVAAIDVSINIGQPGYYGPLDISDFGRPRLIYQEPRIIQRVSVPREPVYLHVPPGHAKNWRKHCGKYNACSDRVYFVQDGWYNREYVPRYQAKHNHGHDMHKDAHREQREERREDRREERDDNHGNKKGHGKNH